MTEPQAVEQSSPASIAADPVIEINSERYLRDARGALVPERLVKPADRLADQTVRKIIGFAVELSAVVSRFRAHTFDDIGALQSLLSEQYGAAIGGRKGNVTLTSIDGTLKVQVQIQDHISFGPELQSAKALVDACITGWADGVRPEIRALVEHAFQVDREGRIDRGALYQLRRLDIDDNRWRAAMVALTDSMRVIGTSTYVRFYRRDTPQAPWRPITIDLASA
ncbi:MAG: DUF3164 family protein [Alphaproteobacteria bacterium]